MQSVGKANADLLNELQKIEARLVAEQRPAVASYRSDRERIAPELAQAQAQLSALEAKRDALEKARKAASASVRELEQQKTAEEREVEKIEVKRRSIGRTCDLYLQEFQEREHDRVQIMNRLQKLKAQAMRVVNHILEVKLGDKPSPEE